MQIDEKLKEKMLKIKALAEWWVWWERENAQRILEKMCENAWITVDDLNDEITHKMTFKDNKMWKLAFQTLLFCFWKKVCDEKVKYRSLQGLRNRRFIELKWTPHEILQAKVAIDHYADLYKSNKRSIMKNLLSSFVNKYDLFPPDNEWGWWWSKLSYEDMMQIHNLMWSMPDDDGPRMRLSKTSWPIVTEIDLHSKLWDN